MFVADEDKHDDDDDDDDCGVSYFEFLKGTLRQISNHQNSLK